MRRREFIKVIVGSAAAWPYTASAQQRAMPVIGFLHIGTPDAYTNDALAAFRRGLQEMDYVEGQNVAIEYHFAENKGKRLPELATDLIHRQVALIVELSGIYHGAGHKSGYLDYSDRDRVWFGPGKAWPCGES